MPRYYTASFAPCATLSAYPTLPVLVIQLETHGVIVLHSPNANICSPGVSFGRAPRRKFIRIHSPILQPYAPFLINNCSYRDGTCFPTSNNFMVEAVLNKIRVPPRLSVLPFRQIKFARKRCVLKSHGALLIDVPHRRVLLSRAREREREKTRETSRIRASSFLCTGYPARQSWLAVCENVSRKKEQKFAR